MADVKQDKAPEEGQLSPQQLEAIVEKVAESLSSVMDKRISGLQGVLDKKVKEIREEFDSPSTSHDDDDISDPAPRTLRQTPSERILARQMRELKGRENELTRRELASEYGLKPEDIVGDTPEGMQLSLALKLFKEQKSTSEIKLEVKEDTTETEEPKGKPFGAYTPVRASGSPVTQSGASTPEGMIDRGVGEFIKDLKPT